jgi:deazaflavin-dependent oxidoreductase (nitroreductase family)
VTRFPQKNDEFLYVTTTGWKSGSPHEIEIWYVARGGCYYLMSGDGERAHWVQNIQRQPAVSLWVMGQTLSGSGRIVDRAAEPELAAAVAALFAAKYDWDDGLIVELCPAGAVSP